MRLTYIELLGNKYPMCFSLAATEKLTSEFGSLEEMQKALTSDNPVKAVNIMLKILMDAGRKYCEVAGIEQPPSLPCDPADVIDVSDPSAVSVIFKAISSSSEREVEVAGKN